MSDPRLWTPEENQEFLNRFDTAEDQTEAILNIWQVVSDAEDGNLDQALGSRESEG